MSFAKIGCDVSSSNVSGIVAERPVNINGWQAEFAKRLLFFKLLHVKETIADKVNRCCFLSNICLAKLRGFTRLNLAYMGANGRSAGLSPAVGVDNFKTLTGYPQECPQIERDIFSFPV